MLFALINATTKRFFVICNRESRKNIFLFDLKSPMIRASFFSRNLFKERREWIARGEGKTFQSILLFIKEKNFSLKTDSLQRKKTRTKLGFHRQKAVGKLELFVSKIKIFYNIYNSEANWQNC